MNDAGRELAKWSDEVRRLLLVRIGEREALAKRDQQIRDAVWEYGRARLAAAGVRIGDRIVFRMIARAPAAVILDDFRLDYLAETARTVTQLDQDADFDRVSVKVNGLTKAGDLSNQSGAVQWIWIKDAIDRAREYLRREGSAE